MAELTGYEMREMLPYWIRNHETLKGDLTKKTLDHRGGGYSAAEQARKIPDQVSTLREANLISSRVLELEDGSTEVQRFHRPLLDLDIDAVLLPSTHEGHHHLYIDKPMPWTDYIELLQVLAKVGIIEPGYASASLARGYTALRPPWVKKGPDE